METYYSVVKIAPNPTAGDSLSIGLLLCDEEGFRFQFSENKKQAAKKLLYENSEVVEFMVKQVEQKLNETNEFITSQKSGLVTIPTLLNSEYFSYLNRYSNGILQFSKPIKLYDKVDSEKFVKLFEILVDKNTNGVRKKPDGNELKFHLTIEKKLIGRVKDKVHTNLKVDKNTIPSLFFQFEIDCLGMNGTLIGAKSLSFSKSHQTLDTQISHYTGLIAHLSVFKKKPLDKNHFYLIADEPSKISSPEHRFWEDVQNNSLFKVICSEESDKVAEIIEETNAKTFLDV